MLIGFTGTQSGMTLWQKEQLLIRLRDLGCTEFVHGDCIGADEEANTIAYALGIQFFTIHPPLHDYKRAYCFNKKKMYPPTMQWVTLPTLKSMGNELLVTDIKVKWMEPYPYLTRNKHIVDSVSLILACPKEYRMSIRSGTWSTIRYAWKLKKDIIIIPPVDRPEEESNSNRSENE